MRTKTVQARRLHVGDEIVDGGNGVRRTAHVICELSVSRTGVAVITRGPAGFDRRPPFDPKDPVRVRIQEAS